MMKPGKFIVRRYLIFIAVLLLAAACTSSGAPEETPVVANTAAPTSTPLPPTEPPPTPVPATPTPMPTAAPTETPASASTETDVSQSVEAVIEDVRYAEAIHPDAQDQLMDIYVPVNAGPDSDPYPVVIWAHGSEQDKSTGKTLGRILSANGFVVMSIDWRDDQTPDRPIFQFREAFEEAECALRMAADRGAEYGADPARVIWGGFSAGSWLGSMVSFSRDDGANSFSTLMEEYYLENGEPPQQVICTAEADTAQIVDYVSSGGVFPSEIWLDPAEGGMHSEGEEAGDLAVLRQFVTIGQNPDMRVRIIQGKFDQLSPMEETETFLAALQEAGYDAALFPQSGGHIPYFDVVIEQILALVEG